MDVEVSIIIVTYNARDLLPDCLDSVAREVDSCGVLAEVIVVDNDSADDTVEWLQAMHPGVRIVATGLNGGMAAGNNAGMLAARGRTFLLLNSDARLLPGSLRSMLDELWSSPRVGMVGPVLRHPDMTLQRSIRGFPTPWRYATEFWYLRRLAPRSRLLNSFYGAGMSHEISCDVEWLMGACMLVRREAVDEVGLMNEAYFMYGEELEWQWMMHESRWRVRLCADAEVVHLGGGTSRRDWGRMYRIQVANHVRCQAVLDGVARARRTRRIITSGLLMRGIVHRIAAILPAQGRSSRSARAAAFLAARRDVLALDVSSLTVRSCPSWPGTADDSRQPRLQQESTPPR